MDKTSIHVLLCFLRTFITNIQLLITRLMIKESNSMCNDLKNNITELIYKRIR